MTGAAAPDPRYRPCVGIMLLNHDRRVFVAERIDTPGAWQMPQGGIDDGESAAEAALRELKEEIGTDHAAFLAEHPRWLSYDLPAELQRRLWGGRYLGQTQKWVAYRFLGEDSDIDLDAHDAEFAAWQWVAMDELLDLIVEFKRDVYASVVAEFRHLTIDSGDAG